MSDQPPPYPGSYDQKGGPPPAGYGYPGGQPGYPPPQGGYAPPPQGYPPPQGGYAPPPQPAYPQQQQQSGTNTVVVSQPAVTVVQRFHGAPVRMTCATCRADIVTAVHYEAGTFSWVICLLLCVFGCNLGCCLIPFCVEGMQDVIHTCPNCHQQIGRWNRM